MSASAVALKWRSEDNSVKSVISFYRVGPRNQSKVIGFVQQAPLSTKPHNIVSIGWMRATFVQS